MKFHYFRNKKIKYVNNPFKISTRHKRFNKYKVI